jgi:hypothetical protein
MEAEEEKYTYGVDQGRNVCPRRSKRRKEKETMHHGTK